MKDEKLHIEQFVAKTFFQIKLDKEVDKKEFRVTDPLSNEPDIVYDDFGIEIGALISEDNTEKDKYYELFLDKLNTEISGRIDKNLLIRLYLQTDKLSSNYKKVDNAIGFKELPNSLTRIDIERHRGYSFKRQVCINQRGLYREELFPNIKSKKKFNLFINELVNVVSSFPDKDEDKYGCSVRLTEFSSLKPNYDPLEKFFSKSIYDKFTKDKYKNSYNNKFLLLHNYNPIIKKSLHSTDSHFYSHYKDYILNRIHELIEINESFKLYDNIFFLDFSIYSGNEKSRLTDFKIYAPKHLESDLVEHSEIRQDFSDMLLTDKNNYTFDGK